MAGGAFSGVVAGDVVTDLIRFGSLSPSPSCKAQISITSVVTDVGLGPRNSSANCLLASHIAVILLLGGGFSGVDASDDATDLGLFSFVSVMTVRVSVVIICISCVVAEFVVASIASSDVVCV